MIPTYPPVNALPIPFVSQNDADSNLVWNDCGAACVLSVLGGYKPDLKLTVNEVYRFLKPKGDGYLHFTNDLKRALKHYAGLDAVYSANNTLDDLRTEIIERKPPIILFSYRVYDLGTEAVNVAHNNFQHFAPVSAFDVDGFYVLDPYLKSVEEAPIFVSNELMYKMWTDPMKHGNPKRAMLAPIMSIDEFLGEEK